MFEPEPYETDHGQSEAPHTYVLREAILPPAPSALENLAPKAANALKLSAARSTHGTLSSVRRVFLRSTALPALSSCHPAIVTRQSMPSSPLTKK